MDLESFNKTSKIVMKAIQKSENKMDMIHLPREQYNYTLNLIETIFETIIDDLDKEIVKVNFE